MADPVPTIPHVGSPMDVTTWWDRYGLLGVGIFVFAGVIVYLFKLMRGDQTAIAAERLAWGIEREKLALTAEVKHRELAEDYAERLEAEIKANRDNENEIRRMDAERLETIAASQQNTHDQIISMVNKLTDRPPARPSRGG